MEVLDEEGRLFGRINVIDAIVIVAAVALLASGVVVVLGDLGERETIDPGPEPERYALVSYEVTLDSPAVMLERGTGLRVAGDSATVGAVHRSTTLNGTAHLTALLQHRGPIGGGVIAGDEVTLVTQAARVEGDIEAVGNGTGSLDTIDQSVVIATNASNPSAATIDTGDEIRVGGEVVAVVQAVGDADDGKMRVGLTLTTRETRAGPSYGGRLLRVGERIGVVTDEAIVRGRIVAMGTTDPTDVG
jgi:hypothetical protein